MEEKKYVTEYEKLHSQPKEEGVSFKGALFFCIIIVVGVVVISSMIFKLKVGEVAVYRNPIDNMIVGIEEESGLHFNGYNDIYFYKKRWTDNLQLEGITKDGIRYRIKCQVQWSLGKDVSNSIRTILYNFETVEKLKERINHNLNVGIHPYFKDKIAYSIYINPNPNSVHNMLAEMIKTQSTNHFEITMLYYSFEFEKNFEDFIENKIKTERKKRLKELFKEGLIEKLKDK